LFWSNYGYVFLQVLYIFSVLSMKLICQSWIYHQWCMTPFLSFFIIQKTQVLL
jgi:hypothetical protein